jgi:hypothetical protein
MCAVKVTGGAKLEAALAKYLANENKVMRAGFLEGGTYPDDGESVASVAAANEYGTAREVNGRVVETPPRPFMRTTVASKGARWAKVVGEALLRNGVDLDAALRAAGEAAVGDIQEAIGTWTEPPNAPATIAKKGFDRPLRETNHMVKSVAYDVVSGTGGAADESK